MVVDEEIYRRLPSLLIATVDKFAQMPWKGEVADALRPGRRLCERHGFRSPEIDDAEIAPEAKDGELAPAARSPRTRRCGRPT